jgi:hypothetical protein
LGALGVNDERHHLTHHPLLRGVSPSLSIFGIIPNNRTSPSLERLQAPINEDKIGAPVILAAAFAADAQLTSANPSFG